MSFEDKFPRIKEMSNYFLQGVKENTDRHSTSIEGLKELLRVQLLQLQQYKTQPVAYNTKKEEILEMIKLEIKYLNKQIEITRKDLEQIEAISIQHIDVVDPDIFVSDVVAQLNISMY